MSLEHRDVPRFTPDQRDAILDLATRLQVQHEATVGADELVRAAEEAGIDPRFVHEAAMRLGKRSRPLPRSLLVPLAFFAVQAGFFVFVQNIWVGGGRAVSVFEVGPGIVMAFLIAVWAARERSVRWVVPLAALAVWFALFVATFVLTGVAHTGERWVLQTAVVFGLTQATAALFGSIAAAGVERLDRPARRIEGGA